MNMQPVRFITLLFFVICGSAQADVLLPRLISDGMVLQRDTSNNLWGWASAGEQVSIKLNGKLLGKATTQAGTWKYSLGAQKAGGPHTLEFIGNNSVQLNKVYFGDVWLAGGQSNMEYTLERIKYAFPDEIPNANNPQIKYFHAPRNYEFGKPKKDFDGGSWLAVTPQTAGKMSAVAWFFAKDIYKKHKVPIGIIDATYGGTTAEGWMSEEALTHYPKYLKVAKSFQNKRYLQGLIDADTRTSNNWWAAVNNNDPGFSSQPTWFDRNLRTTDWPKIDVPSFWQDESIGDIAGAVWYRKEIILPQSLSSLPGILEMGTIIDADMAWINGTKVGETTYQYPRRQYPIKQGILRPGKNVITVRVVNTSGKGGFVQDKPYVLRVGRTNMDLSGTWHYKVGAVVKPLPAAKFSRWQQPLAFYNGMLAPVLNTRIKGAIWYQGESNTERADEYRTLFPHLIRDWRKQFKQGDFPFIFVQLPNYSSPEAEPSSGDWASMRAAQAAALNEPNTAMAVTYDVGEWNDIHPLNKKTVGERVALAARKLVYGEEKLVASGPTLESMRVKGNKVRLVFNNAGSGIVAKDAPKNTGPGGFAIAGDDGKYYWAETKLKKKYLEVWNDKVAQPKKIRYAWANNPTTANLYNKEGLPAPPFEIDVIYEEN